MTLNNLSTIVPFGVHGYYVIDSSPTDSHPLLNPASQGKNRDQDEKRKA